MKVYQPNEIRNFTLVGNAGSGKTTLAEAMLFQAGLINRRGDVANKNTVSDYRDIEHEQGGSVSSTVLYTEFKGKKFNILDAPGADDFVGGMVSSLYVTDFVLACVNAQNGVEVGLEVAMRHAKKMDRPVVFAINHLDHDKTNYDKTIEDLRQTFGKGKVVQVQYPVNPGVEFNAIIDVLKMEMYKYPADGGKPEVLPIPDAEADKAAELQNTLVEAAAENDEALMELFFEQESLSEEQMREGITAGLIDNGIYPVFCTCAKHNMGVGRLMEFIANVTPAPSEMPAPKMKDGSEIVCDADGKPALFIFKNSIEQHLGEVLYFKVLSGTISESIDLINVQKQAKERLSQLYVSAGKNREKVSEVKAGDIGAAVKLKESKTNHTLADKDFDKEFPPIPFPSPKYRTAIKAVNESDDEKMNEILQRLSEEDPTWILEYAKELKQLIIHGQGEFHLNILKWHLEKANKIQVEFLSPRIPYRETITKGASAMYRHKKQSGGAGQFGEVHLYIEPHDPDKPDPKTVKTGSKEQALSIRDKQEIPMGWGGSLVFYNCIVGGVIDSRFMPAILKGLMEKMEEGPLTGSYARDIRVAVYDGKMHPVDSNEISFKIAGARAFSDAFKNAGPKIMEPIYDVEVLVPSDRMGDVMSDLQGRRAIIQGMSSEGGYEKIVARVPLAEMNKYSTALSSLTNGRAMYSMDFAEYAQVPGDIQTELLKAYEAEQDDE